MRFLFTLILLHFLTTIYAQQADKIAYKEFLFAYKYKNPDEKRLRPGELKAMLLSRPEPARYFRSYKRQQWIGIFGFLAGYAIAKYGESPKIANQYYYPKRANPYMVSGIAIGAAGIYLSFHSFHTLHKGVKAYNGELF